MGPTENAGLLGVSDNSSVMTDGWRHFSALKRWSKNDQFKTVDPLDVAAVAALILKVGFVAPIVVWLEADRMVAGHTRLAAMEMLIAADPNFTPRGAPGPGMVRVVFHSFLSEAEADEYALADNRLQRTHWNEENLGQYLRSVDADARGLLGFRDDDDDVRRMLASVDTLPRADAEVVDHLPGNRSRAQQPTLGNGQWDAQAFNAATIKQVVLMLSAEQFERAMNVLQRLQEAEGLESNTDAVLLLLERWDTAQAGEKNAPDAP